MRNVNEILPAPASVPMKLAWHPAHVERLVSYLECDGIVLLPSLLPFEQLRDMQEAFAARLQRMRWNNIDGYQQTELYRHLVDDVLQLEQGFVDIAIHPLVKEILTRYLGPGYELTEAKGWKSLPTKRDFHGWHGDAWYDQTLATEIHREVKLAMYLTDVRSGAFNFIKSSHRQQHPRQVKASELRSAATSQVTEVKGRAGTAFLFDTSGIHRQGVPVLEPREAIFYNYHDPRVPLQPEDISYYRYHPLLLNAAFLGNLSDEDRRILGFGNKTNFQPAFERKDKLPAAQRVLQRCFTAQLHLRSLRRKISRLITGR
jgi:Phytanoyl-CoA dioxygenase (PhyH)